MDYAKLRPEVESLAATNPSWTDQEIADSLNAKAFIGVAKGRVMVRYRTLVSAYGPAFADAVADALEAASAANKTIKRILPTFYGDGDFSGVDVADPVVRCTIDALAAAGVLSADQAAKIKALGEVPISRAEQLALEFVWPGHVRSARQA